MKSLLAAAVTAATLSVAMPASAVAINFDDIPAGTFVIPDGYNGLDWDNFFAGAPDDFSGPPSGYQLGLVSPGKIALNGFGDPATISSATDFSLVGGSFTGAWNEGLVLTIEGLNDGVSVFTQSFTLSSLAPTLFAFNRAAIDTAIFSSAGGTPNPDYVANGDGTQFVVDDLTIGNAVPEPQSWALMIAGFAMVGGALRQRAVRAFA